MPSDDRSVTKKELDTAMSELRAWIAERLEAQERRLEERLEAQESRLEERLEAQERRLEERLEAQERRFAERLEAQETRLLTAFHRYAEANHLRIQKVEVEQHLDGDRLTKLEERVRVIEERLDFPNQFRQRQQ